MVLLVAVRKGEGGVYAYKNKGGGKPRPAIGQF